MSNHLRPSYAAYRLLIIHLFLLAVLSSCTVLNRRKDKGFGASYSYTYSDTITEGDSLLVTGRVVDPTGIYKTPPGIVVTFTPFDPPPANEIAKDEHVWCDNAGNFTVKLKKDNYDIYASNPQCQASFVIYGLGQSGNSLHLEIHMQIRQREEQ